MDLDEILTANEEYKKTQAEIDKTPIKQNKVGGVSADNTDKLQGMLPGAEQQFKLAENLASMINTASRAGAGGTRVGVPGIRPNGGKAAASFLDDFATPGKMKKQAGAYEEKVQFKESKRLDVKKPSVVIHNKCMDCMGPLNLDEVVPSMVIIPPPMALNPITRAKWQGVGLQSGDIVCYCFCLQCATKAMLEAEKLNKSGVVLIENGQQVTLGQKFLKANGERISDNVFQFIQHERDNPDSEIFYSW